MSNAKELLDVSSELRINTSLLSLDDSKDYLSKVIQKFKPEKKTGHLSIGGDSIVIPLEDNEFVYSANLVDEPLFVFFDQEGLDRKKVVCIFEGKKLCNILENAYGMEYFISNERMDYLIAVNWYVIEGVGDAKKWLKGN